MSSSDGKSETTVDNALRRQDIIMAKALGIFFLCWTVSGWWYAFSVYASQGMLTVHGYWPAGNVFVAYVLCVFAGLGGPLLPIVSHLAGWPSP